MRMLDTLLLLVSLLCGCGDLVGLVVDRPPDSDSTEPFGDTLDTDDTDSETEMGTDISDVPDAGTEPEPMPYLLGADVSWVQEQEDLGVIFTENGVEKDFFQILSDHGFNAIRLRLFNDPGQPDGYQFAWGVRADPYCDLAHTIEIAKRVKNAGMYFMLNFHYSDTWADPGTQAKPAAWANLTFEELKQALYEYTKDVIRAFAASGCLPDMVQLGNEITSGLLFPDGKTYDPDNWGQTAELLIAAADAAREAAPGIRIVLHLDRAGDNETTVWWLEEALSRGVTFDVLAQSAYTLWQGEPASWRENFSLLAEQYPELSFVVAEYADNHREVNEIMRDTPRGLGTFVWEPTADGDWGQGLFDMPDGAGIAVPRETLLLFDEMAMDYGLK